MVAKICSALLACLLLASACGGDDAPSPSPSAARGGAAGKGAAGASAGTGGTSGGSGASGATGTTSGGVSGAAGTSGGGAGNASGGASGSGGSASGGAGGSAGSAGSASGGSAGSASGGGAGSAGNASGGGAGSAGNAPGGAGGGAGGPVGKLGCTVPALIADPLVAPEGFTGHLVPWEELFFGATFPEGQSYLSPVGAFTLRKKFPSTKGPSMNARFLYTPFVATEAQFYKVGWVGAQPIASAQYGMARAAKQVFVSISRCAGDLRAPVKFSPDVELSACRGMASNGNMFFGTQPNSLCKLVPGETYYLNIAMVDPTDGLTLDETTCADGFDGRCEANFDGR